MLAARVLLRISILATLSGLCACGVSGDDDESLASTSDALPPARGLRYASAALTTPNGANLVVLPRPPARVSSVFSDDWVAPFAPVAGDFVATKASGALAVTLGAAGSALAVTVDPMQAAFAGDGQTELSFSFSGGTPLSAGLDSVAVALDDDDAATMPTWVLVKPYATTGALAANTTYAVTVPMSALNPAQRSIRRLLVGNATNAGVKLVLDDVRFSWTDAAPTDTLVYGDAAGQSFAVGGWGSSVATNTFRTTGANAIKGTFTAAWSAVTFTRDWSLAAYPAKTHTTVSFDISGGAGAVPAAMSSMLIGLDGSPKVPLSTYVPGGLKANTWHRVTVPVAALVSGAYRQVTFKDQSSSLYSFYVDNVRFQVDHAPPALRVTTPPPPPPPPPNVEPAVLGPAGCAPVVRRDRTIAARATDQYEWRDQACALRTASMVRSDPKGGHAIEFSYPVGATQRVVSASPEQGSVVPAGGFGYVVSHLADPTPAFRNNADDSPLGSALGNGFATLFAGSHHAIHQFTVNYPRWANWGGRDVLYDMPVTVHWYFHTGSNAPVYAITYDLSAAPANAVTADMRAPYGSMNFDGAALGQWGDVVGGVAWGDTYKFTSLATNGLTLNSAWSWNEANTGPAYNSIWTKNVDAEFGSVGTHVLRMMDAGGYNHGATGRGTSSAAGFRCANDTGLNNLSHLMPCASNWSYQSANWSFWDNNGNPALNSTTTLKRFAWGSDWGTLGQSTVTTVNGNVVHGWPRVSYSTYVLFDAHSKAPTAAAAARVAVVNATALTANVGALRTSGAAGIGRSDTMTYSPAGYSPVYETWELDAAANAFDVRIDAPTTGWLENPTFVVHGFTGAAPTQITLDGAPLAAEQGFFASVRPGSSELWITVNAKVRGPGHRLALP